LTRSGSESVRPWRGALGRARAATRALGSRLAIVQTRFPPWLGQGLPSAGPTEELVGAMVAGAAVLWMLAVALWGIGGRFGDGHFAASAAMAVAADNMWLHKVPYPFHYYAEAGPSGGYYMHHPLGVYWVEALCLKVFGAHDWVLRFPAIVYSTLSPLFLYRFGRAAWGPLAGAVSALAFVSLPITLGFSNFHALEGPVIFGIAMACWGYARFTQTWRTPYALASMLGFFWAVNHDWVGYVWGAMFLSWAFLRGFILPPRLFGAVDSRGFGRYWGLMVGVALASLTVFAALLLATNKISDLLNMYGVRSSGNMIPVSAVLAARHIWIEMMFPGLAIVLGKIALPVIVTRLVLRRSDLELLPIIVLLTATFQYLHFKQGADVHIFWPQYFAEYFALGMGALVAGIAEALSWARRRFQPRPTLATFLERRGTWIAAGLVTLPLLFVLKDGASMIRLARESGGRFVSTDIKSDIDRVDAIRWWIPRLAPGERVAFHGGITPIHWSLSWEMRPHQLLADQRLGDHGTTPRAYLMDSRFADTAELRAAARAFHVDLVDGFWFIDRSAPPAPLTGYSFAEREPGPLEWYFEGGTEPLRTVRADAWVTWEWRTLLNQPATPPTGSPATPEQLRVAHNAAIAVGNVADAQRWRAALAARWNIKCTAKFDDGTELLGAIHGTGAERSLSLYFVAGPHGVATRAKFAVSAQVIAPPRVSTLPLDPVIIEVDQPPVIPTDLWQPGRIYSIKLTYRKRPGTERFFGTFVSLRGDRAPALVGGQRTTNIVVL
jgi:Dolichyl-phosphate-mannose-protein mannosyltransferase